MIRLSPHDLSRIAEIVREETGNQVQEKNFSMIEARMRSYLDRFPFPSMQDYWRHFSENERGERDAIAGLMTTHYTFFFREFLHFEILEKWLRSSKARLAERYKQTGRPVQVWSAACSRGQEVYSLAMFLDHHLTPEGIPFQILGSDIDQESVNYAQNGVYPLKEVNSIPLRYLAKHVRKGTGGIKDFAAIHPDLKRKTVFRVLNLMDIPPDLKPESFDVIFCRNVFIYFSDERVRKIAMDLSVRLSPEGVFFSGISEPLRFDGWNLSNFGPSSYFKGVPKPLDEINPVGEGTDKEPAPIQGGSPRYRVLCVDDSPTIQKLMGKIFQRDPSCRGMVMAGNGKEAADLLRREKFDLITLDIHMPEVNGIEFLARFYRRDSDPPVLMVSSVNRSDVDLATKALSLGAFDYVEKPSMNQIEKSSNEILAKAKLALNLGTAPKIPEPEPGDAAQSGGLKFDLEIGRKIVVPDASRCLRIVSWNAGSRLEVEQIVQAQKNEYRSPALLILARGQQEIESLQEALSRRTERPIETLQEGSSQLRPNRIYLATRENALRSLRATSPRQISLQVIDGDFLGLGEFSSAPSTQILLSENMKDRLGELEKALGRKVADVTPVTSFASLSVEYFAMLRTAAS